MALSTKKSNDKRKADKEDKELKEVQPPRKKLVGANNEELKAMDPINDPVDPPAVPAPVRYFFVWYACRAQAVLIPLVDTYFELLPRELLGVFIHFALASLWNEVYDCTAVYVEVIRRRLDIESRYRVDLDRFVPAQIYYDSS